mgnify:CR=1 FL=1|jgi:hypothetical protein
MRDIKIITIGIESVPEGFCNPVWLKLNPYPIRLGHPFGDGLDIRTLEDFPIRMEYPLTHFAYTGDRLPFYIREKDKKAFEDLFKGLIIKERKKAVEEFAEYLAWQDGGDKDEANEAWRHWGGLAQQFLSETKEAN